MAIVFAHCFIFRADGLLGRVNTSQRHLVSAWIGHFLVGFCGDDVVAEEIRDFHLVSLFRLGFKCFRCR